MNELCRIYERGMSQAKWHIWIRHVTNVNYRLSYMYEACLECHIWMSCMNVLYVRGMSQMSTTDCHILMSYMYEACLECHIWMSYTYVIYVWVMSQVIYECHIWMSCMYESCRKCQPQTAIYVWGMSRMSYMNVIYECHKSTSYMYEACHKFPPLTCMSHGSSVN